MSLRITKMLQKQLSLWPKCHYWFSKFHSGNMSLRDEPRPGHSSDLDQDALRELVKCNPHKSILELSFDFNIPQSTMCSHLTSIWVSHTLSEKYKEDYIFIMSSLLQGREMTNFLRISLQEMKSGSFRTMFNVKGNGLT